MMSSTTVLTLPVCSGIQCEVYKLARCKIGGGIQGIEKKHCENFQELEAQLLESISTSGFCSFLFLSYIRLRNMLVLSLCLTVSSTAAFRKKKRPAFVGVVLKVRELLLK